MDEDDATRRARAPDARLPCQHCNTLHTRLPCLDLQALPSIDAQSYLRLVSVSVLVGQLPRLERRDP